MKPDYPSVSAVSVEGFRIILVESSVLEAIPLGIYRRFGKRILDVILSLVFLIVGIVPMLVIALLIAIDSGHPVIFRQERIGLRRRPFTIYKFRTMFLDADSMTTDLVASGDDERLTRMGKRLRRWGLDELPQLWNVLRSDMSLIGPRPTLAYQVNRYNGDDMHRLDVRPGITGLAQVSGRNTLSWTEKIEIDLQYVESFSLWFDMRVLVGTVPALFRRGQEYTVSE